MKDKEYFTVKEVAKILDVKEQTVYRWVYKGLIEVTQKVKKGAIRIHKLEIPAFRRQKNGD